MSGALHGLRVIDFSKFLPGPYCTWMLAELGAEVIRIENPRELAKQRKVFGWDKLDEQQQALLRARDIFARGKRSVLLDPGHPRAQAALHELIRSADILVEDYRPGVMASMGYGYEAMQTLNPRLIYCAVTLCGQTGPEASKPGHDPVALALAGALSRIGENPDAPSFPGVPVADLLSGSNAVIGVLAAVIARAASGKGQLVDIAMSDAAMALIATTISRHADLERLPPRGLPRADSGIWRTADGRHIVTTDMEPRYWQRFCAVIGRPDLVEAQLDSARWPAIKAEIAAIIATRTQAEWLALFEQAGTQFAPVLSVAEALAHPHNRARGMVLELPVGDARQVVHIGNPLRLTGTPTPRGNTPAAPSAGRPAGADTHSVLASLGYDASAIAELIEEAS
ncbi:MAG: CaiB/BaiF CoA-transferase family protein [Spongiibacteraceae bacterium]|jgi:crotonobetainyl-CoA:carnitine CoA-transferase CaiB-like acyl-CoA transferase|nr:CaiB/BaiF CoA-transferase family protein [Spongiibacteraceae bacterium]